MGHEFWGWGGFGVGCKASGSVAASVRTQFAIVAAELTLRTFNATEFFRKW
jgi:hypothetical protein